MAHGAPVAFGIAPALARGARELPLGEEWCYEQKFDGFRAVAFVSPTDLVLQSRGRKDLTRYFPEVALPPREMTLDGELIIEGDGREEFGTLSQRIHPAASRIERLARESPATYVAFDLLALDGESLLEVPFAQRRELLESIDGLRCSQCTRDPAVAALWLTSAEGVIAKRLDHPYAPGARTAMVKIKRLRTIDCVIIGYRPGKTEGTVGSVILGLYTPEGTLRPVGHSSAFNAREKRELADRLAPFETGERGSGTPSRWTGGRDADWVSLRAELVVECSYDHSSDGRIRHGTTVLRWRSDKAPQACTTDQLD